MKIYYFLLTISFLAFFTTACQKEETVDNRKLVKDPIFPEEQPDALNNALVIFGESMPGPLPESVNSENVMITVSVSSASITNDNFLFLPFAFDLSSNLKGIYLQVDGADNYWEAPIDLNSATSESFAIAIGIPGFIQQGSFTISYKLYDDLGNVSSAKSIDVSIVPTENKCGTGEGFPRVEGEDGITVKTYDFGDQPGEIIISYYMYTQKDRMDIRYDQKWIASTSPELLKDGEAPPFKTCDEASPADGFVSSGGGFRIAYDPEISREVSIYVSGCLQGGTLWYFDVTCPAGNTPPRPSICGKSSAIDTYDSADENYHIYPREGSELSNIICDTDLDPNCTLAAVFNAMLTDSKFLAPTSYSKPVEDCTVTWVDGYLPGENPVISKINRSSYSVTNFTLKEEKGWPEGPEVAYTHFLHPGKVTRTIEQVGSKIMVKTVGEGTGRNIFNLNVNLAKLVWDEVDEDLKKYWDEQ